MLRSLFQPRYAALTVLMTIVAGICVAAGTWQIARLAFKINTNADLRSNAHALAQPIADLAPVQGTAPRPRSDAITYRQATATGTYLPADQTLVRRRSVNGITGYLVLTPLRTTNGPILLIVRGFVADNGQPAGFAVPAPPGGQVTVTATLRQADDGRDDDYAALHNGQIEWVVPAEQSARIGTPVYDTYGELRDAQPGTSDLTVMPAPDLSNPAGGAVEPQHLAYIIQWYLFAALALAAPIAMIRHDRREPEVKRGSLDDFAEAAEPHPAPDVGPSARARIADRYRE